MYNKWSSSARLEEMITIDQLGSETTPTTKTTTPTRAIPKATSNEQYENKNEMVDSLDDNNKS